MCRCWMGEEGGGGFVVMDEEVEEGGGGGWWVGVGAWVAGMFCWQ